MSTMIDTALAGRDAGIRDDAQALVEKTYSKRLAGKVAVVTGGSTGMGLATAQRFVLEGMDHVFITGRRREVLDRAVAEIGEKATGVPGDVANLNELDQLYEVVKQYGRNLDVIFANAGIALQAPLGSVDEKFFDLHFNANVKGLFFTIQKGLPFIKNGGSIILNGSIATIKGSLVLAFIALLRQRSGPWQGPGPMNCATDVFVSMQSVLAILILQFSKAGSGVMRS
jgi:short chain dehydrogenase